MINKLSVTEKFAAATASCVLAAVSLLASLKLEIPPSYSDFVVGSITWDAGSKFQDLIVVPVFIIVIIASFFFFSFLIERSRRINGEACAVVLSNQLMWWSLPVVAILCNQIIWSGFDERVFFISALGIFYIATVFFYGASRKISTEIFGLSGLAFLLISLVPLEIALVAGRLLKSVVAVTEVSRILSLAYLIGGLGFVVGFFLAIYNPKKLSQITPVFLFFSQIGLPFIFLTLYPARFVQPDGSVFQYKTTIWLEVLVAGFVLWGVVDVIRRYHNRFAINDLSKLLSPIALFALLVGLKMGGAIAPQISPDDYHFGESLLGWWSYLQGAVPYVGYVPAHGFIDDDLALLLSYIFYDGSAGSVAESGRISFAILAFVAFISIYLFSGSIGLAFIAILFLGGKFTWFFLTPFICLWFSPFLRASPSRWLAIWLLTAPIIILGVPPQGLLLVFASVLMVAYFVWRLLSHSFEREWTSIGVSVSILLVLGSSTPLISMLMGAIGYVLENGQINQVAYGVPWSLSWGVWSKSGFVFELIRMSWIAIPITCILVFCVTIKDAAHGGDKVFPVIFVCLFTLLLIPYSMGRIDPDGVSRPGLAAVFGWSVLLPIAVWWLVKLNNRVALILLAAGMSATLNFAPLSFSNLIYAAYSDIGTPILKDGQSIGLPNIGKAHVQDEHWDRLSRLNVLLGAKLTPGETYLDLTSRNAQYFYLNRKPVVAVTAPYNMVPLSQQKRAVQQLSQDLPKLALLEGGNITNDGGGLALRNPYLYRFIIDNYVPRYEGGFIFGYSKKYLLGSNEVKVEVVPKNVSDANWYLGVHRSSPAVLADDPLLVSFLKSGDQIVFRNGEVRKVQKVWRESSAIWLDGGALDPSVTGYPNSFSVIVAPEAISDYRVALFQYAFSQPNLNKIPVAWGRSEETLREKFSLIKSFDSSVGPALNHLGYENGEYRINGVDSFLLFDISKMNVSGRDVGLLRFDFSCSGGASEARMQVFWWGDNEQGPVEESSIRFTADSGTLIVPVDASPQWLTLKHVKGLRIDIEDSSACSAFSIKNIKLLQRKFE